MADHALATIGNPSSALTDFTLVVDLANMPASWWAAVDTADGTKGRVYKGDGLTRLAADWINFDSVAQTGLLRVLWSGTLASTGAQELWIEPPVAANASVLLADVYGGHNAYDANWVGYWPDGGADRTVSGNNGVGANGAAVGAVSGQIGDATDLDGVDDHIIYGSVAPIASGDEITALIWANPDTLTASTSFYDGDALIAKASTGATTNEYEWAIQCENSGSVWFRTNGGNNGGTTAKIPVNGWSQVGVSYVAGGSASTFVNASAETSNVGDLSADSGYPVVVGETGVGTAFLDYRHSFNGQLCEAQVHNVARSADWVSQEYAQTSSNDTFYSAWAYVPDSAGSVGETFDTSNASDAWSALCAASTSTVSTASASDSLSVIASINTSIISAAQASDQSGESPAASASLESTATGSDTLDALASAAAALSVGAAAGESWTVHAQVVTNLLSGAASSDQIARATENALNAAVSEASAASAQFITAIDTLAGTEDTASASDAFVAVVAMLAGFSSGAIASDSFGINFGQIKAIESGAISADAWILAATLSAALSEVCTARDIMTARADVNAAVTFGAIASDTFAVVSQGIQYLVMGAITLRAALSQTVTTKSALTQSVNIKPGH